MNEQLKLQENIVLSQPGEKLKWSLLDYSAIEAMIKVFMWGAANHKDNGHNNGWKDGKGERYSKQGMMDSMQRHLAAMMKGEEIDPESGQPHNAHLACNAMMYNYFHLNQNK